jgi:hypothetical protein
MQVCAEMLGRELKDKEEENAFLHAEIEHLERALKRMFDDRALERERVEQSWSDYMELQAANDQVGERK